MTLPTWFLVLAYFALTAIGVVSTAAAHAAIAQPAQGQALPAWLVRTWLSGSLIGVVLGFVSLIWVLWRLATGGAA